MVSPLSSVDLVIAKLQGRKRILDFDLNIPRRVVHILLSKEGLSMRASISVVVSGAAPDSRRVAALTPAQPQTDHAELSQGTQPMTESCVSSLSLAVS